MSHQQVHDHDEIRKHVRAYILVFAALWTLTVITVAISYLHLQTHLAVALAVFVATIKGSLVACYFMHLLSEKKLIYLILAFTLLFFVGLLFLPVFGLLDQVAV